MTPAQIIDLARSVEHIVDAEYLRGFRDGYERAMRDVNENRGERLIKARTIDEFVEAMRSER